MTIPDTAEDRKPAGVPWRRFVGAGCTDCPWRIAVRDYRSRRAINAKAMLRAAARHAAETGHEHVGVFTTHG